MPPCIVESISRTGVLIRKARAPTFKGLIHNLGCGILTNLLSNRSFRGNRNKGGQVSTPDMSMGDILDLVQRRDREVSIYLETYERNSKAKDPAMRAEAISHLIVTLMEGHRLRMEFLRRTGCQETFRLMNDRYLKLCGHLDKVSKASGSAKRHRDVKVQASEFRSFGRELVEFTKDMNLVKTVAVEFLQLGMD